MRIGGLWLFGSLVIVFAWLHYRFEAKPYATKNGRSREEVRTVLATVVQGLFESAWPRNDPS
jgi:hypothetical protein